MQSTLHSRSIGGTTSRYWIPVGRYLPVWTPDIMSQDMVPRIHIVQTCAVCLPTQGGEHSTYCISHDIHEYRDISCGVILHGLRRACTSTWYSMDPYNAEECISSYCR